MQQRQTDRRLYFQELAQTSEKYYIPYISKYKNIAGTDVLEIGCGDGGNLLPFAQMGCRTTGVDIVSGRITDAKCFFEEQQAEGTFITSDIFMLEGMKQSFDIIICHDVIEHIANKTAFLTKLQYFLRTGGLLFIAFPAWQMPFGGHQQICRNKILSHLPFIHLLPTPVYKALLKRGGEDEHCINELLSIKKTQMQIEPFERLLRQTEWSIVDRTLFFINPHYEIKFGLKPHKLSALIEKTPYIRNFCTTACFYLLKPYRRFDGQTCTTRNM